MGSRRARLARWAVSLFLSLLLAWPWPAWPQNNAPRREVVAVLDFDASGATKVEAGAVTDRLREELLRVGRYTVVDRGQIEAILNEQALQQSGCTTQECAVQVGQLLGVRKIISGRVTKLGEEQWLVSSQLIDVESGETRVAESLRHRGDLFTLVDVVIVDLARRLSVAPASEKPVEALVKELPLPAAPLPPSTGAPAVPPPASTASAPEQTVGPSIPEPPFAEPTAAAAAEEGGWPWWVWTLIGVGIVGAAAAGGGGGDASACSSGSGCGQISAGW